MRTRFNPSAVAPASAGTALAAATLAGSLLLLISCASGAAYIPTVPSGYRIPADFKIVGYFPSWSGDPRTIQYRELTHICYAFATPMADGSYAAIPNERKLMDLAARAHAAGVKVLLSVGGGGTGYASALAAIAADSVLTEQFVDRSVDLIGEYGLDGIDMDWEFPAAQDALSFSLLMHALSARLHEAGLELSIAVSATSFHGKNCLDSVIEDVDFLNIMAYDDGYGVPGAPHSSYWYAQAAMDYWLVNRSVPKAKAILGVPFYGRSLTDRHSISYSKVLVVDPWASSADVSGEFGYNGFDTLRAKAVNLARLRGGGIMIWQLNQDADGSASLLNAIFDAIKEPVPPAAVLATAGPVAAPAAAVVPAAAVPAAATPAAVPATVPAAQ